MSQTKFRHPKEMSSRKERVPLSTRVLTSTKDTLEKAAKANGLSLAELCATVLDDYAGWLVEEASKKKR
jgi:uncharacterized protein (DUF1778 family)